VTALAGAASATLSTTASTLDCIEDVLCRLGWNGRVRLAIGWPHPSYAASEEQHDDDNQQHPDNARGAITIGMIAPGGQTSQQEHD